MTSLAVTGYKKNRLFPSYLLPLFQNQSSWETIHMFRLQAHFHANQTHFHKKAIARRLVLKEQLKVTQKCFFQTRTGTVFQRDVSDAAVELNVIWKTFEKIIWYCKTFTTQS